MRRPRPHFALAAVLIAAAVCAAPATASASQVVADCNTHGKLTAQYSAGELRTALATLPADVKEYTDCYDVIQRALIAQAGSAGRGGDGGSPPQGSGGSFLPAPLIAVLAVLAVGGAGFAVLAARRREGSGGPDS